MKTTTTALAFMCIASVLLAKGDFPKSSNAKLAKVRYDKKIGDARKIYLNVIADARKAYIKELDDALKVAMRKSNLDEANKINVIKKSMEKWAAYAGSYTWYWKTEAKGTYTLWPDGSMAKDGEPLELNWRFYEDHLVVYSPTHQYYFEPVPKNGVFAGKALGLNRDRDHVSINTKLVRK